MVGLFAFEIGQFEVAPVVQSRSFGSITGRQTHVVLRAADPKALERFYLDALGLRFERREGKLAQLRAGDALIDIVPADEAGPAGGTSSTGGVNLDHLCLRVEPFDGAAIAKHLAAQGVALTCPDLFRPSTPLVSAPKTWRPATDAGVAFNQNLIGP